MSNTTTTFLGFIQDHSIQIPLIQRDYVQGLALDDKTKEKRDEFVKKLLDAILPSGKPYTLDFIYGARESYDGNEQNSHAPFLPLDGQQRLTTLYILHWILAVKTNTDGCYDFVLELLKKFSYKTRISSDKFCRRLLGSKFEANKSLYEQIKNKTWYVSLETDPTVIAIMEMTKQIELTLAMDPYRAYQKELAANLFSEEEQRITFSRLDMERYHLTDGLYVKMNARGKELTPFENWKADFINLISGDEATKDRFTRSIEHEWNDLFWKDVYKNYVCEVSKAKDEKEKAKIKYPRIDEHFMNFFTNFSRLFFFIKSNSENPKVEDFNGNIWSTTETLFGQNKDLVEKLFDVLDALVKIDATEGVERFFKSLFYCHPSTAWKEHTTSVKLFDGNSINLFNCCFVDDNFGWQHVMLFAVLKYCVKYKVCQVTEELKKYTRICRNYLYQHNYLDTGEVKIVPQIRVVDMKTYDKVFEHLCSEPNPIKSLENRFDGKDADYLDVERNKTIYYNCANWDVVKLVQKIEDMSFCYGNIQAFDEVLRRCVSGSLSCERVWDAIYSFRNANGLQKAKLFVAYNYKGKSIGNNCAYGKRIFIGGNYRGTSRWDVHFRKNENEFGNWITRYVEAYMQNSDIDGLIAVERDKIAAHPCSMRDYMLKYEDVIAAHLHTTENKDNAPFYFAMPNPWQDMDAIVIHSFSNRPLGKSYQTCPMANAVIQGMSNFDKNHMGYAGQGSWKAGVYVHDGTGEKILFSLRFAQRDWRVNAKYFSILSLELQNYLESVLDKDGTVNSYRLLSNGDLIKDAIAFMEKVIIEFKSVGII